MYIIIKFYILYVSKSYINSINTFILPLSHTDAFRQNDTTASYTLKILLSDFSLMMR